MGSQTALGDGVSAVQALLGLGTADVSEILKGDGGAV